MRNEQVSRHIKYKTPSSLRRRTATWEAILLGARMQRVDLGEGPNKGTQIGMAGAEEGAYRSVQRVLRGTRSKNNYRVMIPNLGTLEEKIRAGETAQRQKKPPPKLPPPPRKFQQKMEKMQRCGQRPGARERKSAKKKVSRKCQSEKTSANESGPNICQKRRKKKIGLC